MVQSTKAAAARTFGYNGPLQFLALFLVLGGLILAAGTWPGYIMPIGTIGHDGYVPGHWEETPVVLFKLLGIVVAGVGGWMRTRGRPEDDSLPTQEIPVGGGNKPEEVEKALGPPKSEP